MKVPQKLPRLPLLLAALALAQISAPAQTLLFDFGGNGRATQQGPGPANDPDRAWNNINSVGVTTVGTPAAQLNAAITTANVATGINLVMLSRFNGNNDAGTTVSTLFPSNASSDSLYGNTETFGGGANFFPSFKLTGLNTFATHDITFYASRTGAADNRETQYTVTGAVQSVAFLNPANNVDEKITLTGLKSNASGEITVLLGPGPNNNNANHFTYLGVMKVDVIPSTQQPIVFTQEPADITALAGRPVTFTAAVNSTPPYTIQWKVDNVPIPDANGFSYTIPAVSLSQNQKRYSVSINNNQFSGNSRAALLTVNPDNTLPTLTSITSRGPYHIALTFSEELEAFSAAEIFNYSVNGGSVFILSAVLQADKRTIILEPSSPLAGNSVTVSVSNVRDLANNSILSDTTLSTPVPRPDGKSLLIDFGGDATLNGGGNNDPLNFWNNVSNGIGATDGGQVFDMVKNDGTVTPSILTILARFNAANTNGTLTGGPFAPNATRDSLFGNLGDHGGLTNIFPRFEISGLTPGVPHELTFYASRLAAADNRETLYTITGANTVDTTLNPSENVGNKAVVTNVMPTAAGTIEIALTVGANNNNGVRYIYLGALQITAGAAAAPPQMLTPVISNGQITVSWTGSGVLETSTTLSGTWTPVIPAPTSPFIENVFAGQKKFYRIRP